MHLYFSRNRHWSLAALFLLFGFSMSLYAQEKGGEQEDIDVMEMMNEGLRLSESGQHHEAAEVFRRVTEADASVGQAWLMYGYSLHMEGKYDEALPIHEKASTMRGFESIGLYNMACVHAIRNRKDAAFDFLERSMDRGFDDPGLVDTDSDLDNLRQDPRFGLFVKWAKSQKKPDLSLCHFAGTWTIVSGSRGGNEIETDDAVPPFTVSKDRIVMPGPEGQQGFEMSYTADPEPRPMRIEMKIEAGPGGAEGMAKGIVTADRKSMKICYDPTGNDFPGSFEANAENGFFLFESRRVPSGLTAQDLEGSWKVVSGMKSGAPVAAEVTADKITFTADSITIPAGDDAFVMSYTLELATSPVAIDMTMMSGPAPEGIRAFGILKREGDDLLLCYNANGENRPEVFESTEENQFFLFTLRRAGK